MIGADRRATIRTMKSTIGKDPTVPYRTDSRLNLVPGNKLPGYDHLVPPGQSPVFPSGQAVGVLLWYQIGPVTNRI